MYKFRAGLLVATMCVAMATLFCLWAVADAPAQDGPGVKPGKGTRAAAIFVKGHYAYVLDAYVTDPGGTNSWLHIINIEDINDIEECAKLGIRRGRDIFVAGDSMYVATDMGLIKYDVTDPCDPESLDFGQHNCSIVTELYVTDNDAYASSDAQGVFVWDVSGSLGTPEWWTPPSGSPQGIHVRLPYAYIACEALSLWSRHIPDSTDYEVDTTDWSYDAYNVGLEDTSRALSYEAAGSHIRAWDTTDPSDPSCKGSDDEGGPACQTVHVTGDWVYRLGSSNQVEVYPVEYGAPNLDTSYTVPGTLYDFHVIHERYMGGPAIPRYGSAHIFGVYRSSDTAALWIYSPSWRTQRVNGFKYGDVNKDGTVNISDALLINWYVRLGYNGLVKDLDAADVNCDGEINTYDYDYLAAYLWQHGPAPGADCDFYNDW
jgi:hypothetical protein